MARRRDHGTGTIYRDKDRDRWIGEVVLDGRRRRVTARRRPDASAKLARLIRDHDAGTATLDGATTVAKATAVWRERVLPARTLSPSSVKRYHWLLDLIDAELGPVRLRALDVERIEGAFDNLVAGSQGRPLGRDSIKLVRSALGQVLDTAVRRGMLSANRARLAVLPVTPEPEEAQALDVAQSRVLWAALAEEDTSWAAALQLQLLTGLRPGEAAGVCWDAVDLDEGHLTVSRSTPDDINGVAHLADRVKNRSSRRTIGLPAQAVDLLRAQRPRVAAAKLAASAWEEHDLVFPRDNGRPLDSSSQRVRLARVCAAAGLPVLTPHELRHTAGTVMSDQGVPLERIADVLGHVGTRMLDERYRHRVRPVADDHVAVMDALFAERS